MEGFIRNTTCLTGKDQILLKCTLIVPSPIMRWISGLLWRLCIHSRITSSRNQDLISRIPLISYLSSEIDSLLQIWLMFSLLPLDLRNQKSNVEKTNSSPCWRLRKWLLLGSPSENGAWCQDEYKPDTRKWCCTNVGECCQKSTGWYTETWLWFVTYWFPQVYMWVQKE